MKIALFTEVFLPKVDGVVNTLCYLLRYLAAEGHEAMLFVPDRGTQTPAEYAGMPVIKFRPLPFPLYPEMPVVPLLRRQTLHKHLKPFAPDVIHVVNPAFFGLSAIRWAEKYNVPVLASYHTDLAGYARRWGYGFMVPFVWWLTRLIHNRAQLNLAPSKTTMRYLAENGIERLGVWTRGVNTELFRPDQRTAVWRTRLSNGHPDAPLLLFVGRIAPEKRVDWLRPLLDQLPDVRLAIVGDGPARTEMDALFADTNTVFTGYLQGDELAAAFASADIFVFPSPNETFGNVILEAMASGLPPVCAAAGGPLDFVVDGENGLLFEAESAAAFVTAVQRIVRDKSCRQRLAEGALQTAQTRSWTAVLELLIQDYERLVLTAQT